LIRSCAETVDRDRKAANSHFRHDTLPPLDNCLLFATGCNI
jgi:hypothetical protein